jgi:hypothetical protein
MPDDHTVNDNPDVETGTPPELADWWVWGMRKIAAFVADLLLAARIPLLLFALLKGGMWAFTRDPNELWGAGAAVAGFFALWAGGLLFGHFSAERDVPDPERWLMRQRRTKGR